MSKFTKEIKIKGVGVHSGKPANLIIKPWDKKEILFKRLDMKNSKNIPAKFDNVSDTSLRNTTVGDENGFVQTIEHLMAALFVSGVDSAMIEIDGPETPILDGSAKEFIKVFDKVKTSGSKLNKVIVKKEITVKKSEVLKNLSFVTRVMVIVHDWLQGRRNNGYVKLIPDDRGLVINAKIDFPDKIIGKQEFEFVWDGSKKAKDLFLSQISSARTFGKYSEWEYLKSKGMARGATEKNIIALNDKGDGTLNKLQWDNEFVRHIIVDLMGDMFTSGSMIVGRVEAYKGGHAMNNMLLRKLFSNPDNYEIIKQK